MNVEKVIKNGKGLASVSKIIESEVMVELKIHNWRDLDLMSDYNFEYSVKNNLTDYGTSFHHYYDGGDISGDSEKEYKKQVAINVKLISKVKEYLAKNNCT